MSLTKNSILIILSTILLAGSIFFTYDLKRRYKETLTEYKELKGEVRTIKKLQKVWSGKLISKKVEKALSRVSPNKKSILVRRKKVTIKLKSVTDKELNYVLSRLASLPLQFKELKVIKSGETFNLECLCVW